jgi:hypothetical protein
LPIWTAAPASNCRINDAIDYRMLDRQLWS